jgi:hypothetical protein
MKKTLTMAFAVLLFFGLASLDANACKIDFKVIEGEKEQYETGDKLTIQIDVFYTHGRCPEGIKATQFKYNGLKVTGATKWKTLSSRSFTRKVKVEIQKVDGENAVLSAVRTCDKEGGFGEIKLPMKQ